MKEWCTFCLESKLPAIARGFLGQDWPYEDRILYDNEHVFAVPGVGPQVYPYALVVSRRHFRALAESSINERKGLFDALDFLISRNVFKERNVCVFEHGDCAPEGSCMEHFHLHVIDSKYGLASGLAESDSQRVVVSESHTLQIRGRYHFVGTYCGERRLVGLVSTQNTQVHQYFRKVLASIVGESWWDWRESRNPALMERLVREVRESP